MSKSLGDRAGFNTIQDAIDGNNPQNGAGGGASPGDTIFIEEGTFTEEVSVPTQDVTLVGRGAGETIIQGQIDATGSGFGLRETTVRAEPNVTDDTALLVDDGANLTVTNNTIVARQGGFAVRVKQPPQSGGESAIIQNNTIQSLGNETAQSLVVVGSNGGGSNPSLDPVILTDGGVRSDLNQQPIQNQVTGSPSSAAVQIIQCQFVGNVSGQGVVQFEVDVSIDADVENNDFSETVLFDQDADPVTDEASGAEVDITLDQNEDPAPLSASGGISVPGSDVLRVADISNTNPLPDLKVNEVADSLVSAGSNLSITNPVHTGDERALGVFNNAGGPLNIGNGIILGTGQVTDVQGPNEDPSTQTSFGTPGDSDLEDLPTITNETFDASTLSFDLDVPSGVSNISFRYVFGSEEYNEFTASPFNDVFAFFVNGENVATVPDPDNPNNRIAASINNVNHGENKTSATNPQLFINNDPHDGELVTVNPQSPPGPGIGFDPSSTAPGNEPFNTEMDGFTTPLKVTAPVNPGTTNTVKIAIADVSDRIFSSWVLLPANSFVVETGPTL